ncbi:MAG: DUF3467 domain-containing protein [Planctomycetia bacterium]|nr:DUF3467 domain-containing protein [Planctomycetia bacterium]
MSTDVNNNEENRPQQYTVQINDKNAVCAYANFCRVSGAPEEILFDFGLNPQPVGIPTEPIDISQRIVMNYYTAKRMFLALEQTLRRHEATFGVIETVVQRRVRPGVLAQPVPAADSQEN